MPNRCHSSAFSENSLSVAAQFPNIIQLSLAGRPEICKASLDIFGLPILNSLLGPPPVVPFCPLGSPTKIDYRKRKSGTLILTSLLEDLDYYLLRHRKPARTQLD